ncbi:hypothetical protein OG921_01130 [Aldersonia sp. NBC_00410]|uniref:hypothetical protein n=1 Tax=Aldersonia sp. NBC_00410 TaxID=2975954 RepID=UPI0022549BE2|nr:hypothetical protein [Aldersonia sp. NBC_00410]MCX5041794.1 hypothetical protein [Aldersonia sp. NBC_00410]
MDSELRSIFAQAGGAATYAELTRACSRKRLRTLVACNEVAKLWHGIYAPNPVTLEHRLAGASLAYGRPVTACLGTAAQLFGFCTEPVPGLHILDTEDVHPHGHRGLVVHQRLGAPITKFDGQLVTEPAWTAIEFARTLPRPRALATMDAALATGLCDRDALRVAARRQGGRRGIVAVRQLVEIADGRAQSPMESETRLVFVDAELEPDLQVPVLDEAGIPRFYLDFGWREAMVGVEYDGDAFHSDPLAVRRDKARIGWMQDRGWLIIVVSADDVRRRPDALVARVRRQHAARRPAA